MKSIYLTLVSSFFLITNSFSQEKDSIYINSEELKNILNKYYIKYSSGQETTTSSAFAGLDIEKTTFTFAPTFVTANANVWSAKFEGGITDGVASLFNNNKFNTNVGVEIQYNLNLSNKEKKNIIGFYEEDYAKYRNDNIESIITNLKDLKEFITNNKLLVSEKHSIKEIDALVKKESTSIPSRELEEREQNLLSFYKSLNEELINLEGLEDRQKEILLDKLGAMGNKLAAANTKRKSEFKLTEFHTKWLTIAVNVRNDEFRLLDRTELFENQITKNNYVSFGAKIQYNNFHFKKNGNSIFYNFGLKYQYKNNIDGLKKTAVEEKDIIGNSSSVTRNVNDSYTAYQGVYKENLDQLNINADLYYFINNWQNVGLHFYKNSKFTEGTKPSYDLGAGLVVPFKNKEKETTIINAELYYTVKNLFNTKDINYSLVERNEIGLRFTFPIDFSFN